MGDFNADLIKTGTNGPTAEFLGTFTSWGYYPLASLPTRLMNQTSTLIDNIFTNNLGAQLEADLVKVRVSDHLPIFAMVGVPEGGGQVEGKGRNQRRAVKERRMVDFVIALDSWDFRELRALGTVDNAARFRNEFRDMYIGNVYMYNVYNVQYTIVQCTMYTCSLPCEGGQKEAKGQGEAVAK
jgi:hypothetical protein